MDWLLIEFIQGHLWLLLIWQVCYHCHWRPTLLCDSLSNSDKLYFIFFLDFSISIMKADHAILQLLDSGYFITFMYLFNFRINLMMRMKFWFWVLYLFFIYLISGSTWWWWWWNMTIVNCFNKLRRRRRMSYRREEENRWNNFEIFFEWCY